MQDIKIVDLLQAPIAPQTLKRGRADTPAVSLDRETLKLLASARQNPSPAASLYGGIESVLVGKDAARFGPVRLASVKRSPPEALVGTPCFPLVAAHGFESRG